MSRDKKVLVIGLGRFGTAIVETLWDSGVDVIVVDRDAAAVESVKGKTHAAFVAEGTEPSVLEAVGARDVDAAVVTFGEAFESSVLAVATLKSYGVKDIVARASTPRRADVLRAVGATRVLELERELGQRVAMELVTPSARELIELAGLYRVIPWEAGPKLVGRDLRGLSLRQRYGLNVIGVRAAKEAGIGRLSAPDPEATIRAGDTLLLVGEEKNLRRFAADFGEE
jgi:trk system potassium uptake protein TrkA